MANVAPFLDLSPAQGEWSEADYFPFSDCGRLVELSDGNVEILPVPTYFHQLILLRLSTALHIFVLARQMGYVCFAPLPIRLWPGKIREPDLMFMAAGHEDRIGKYWGVPDLAVEILSEGHEQKDRQVKRDEYAQAGISEYWIVDPEERTIEILRLANGIYELGAILREGDTLESPMFPEFSLALKDVFAASPSISVPPGQ